MMRPVSTRIALAMLLPMAAVFGQPREVHKEVPPPLTLRVEDLCTVTITALAPMEVWVKGEATEETHGLIGRVTTKPFELQSGINRYDVGNIPPIDEKWFLPEFERLIMMTGLFPEGDYWLKVYVYSMGGQLLGSDSVRHVVRYPQLTLVSPPDGSEVGAPDQLFNWAISQPVPGLEYEFSVYEIMPGQTKHDAVNNIPHFRQGGPFTTALQYPPEAKPFESGHSYCWQVRSLVQPNYWIGASEIWEFVARFLAQFDSCTYYLGMDGKMRHSLGKFGFEDVAPESCHYIYARLQKTMYHADGMTWKRDTEPRCTWVMADNGMYHSLGRGVWEGPKTLPACNHILAKNGMWHSTGTPTGWEPVKPESCTYIFSSFMGGKLFHADGSGWKADTQPYCTWVMAKNGMYHSTGRGVWEGPKTYRPCNYILAKNGMWHSIDTGSGWEWVKPESCTYVFSSPMGGKLFHADGTGWEPVKPESCTYILAKNGMFHADGTNWTPVKARRCNYILTRHGMRHFDGVNWEEVRPEFCKYYYCEHQRKIFHGNGTEFTEVTVPVCHWIKAENGMYHFTRAGWRGPARGPHVCYCRLADNGLFHWGRGDSWRLVPPVLCTYAYDNEHKQMIHGTGTEWEAVTGIAPCNYIKAHNGMYHWVGESKGWVLEPTKMCKYLYSEKQETMWHSTDTEWAEVPREPGKVIHARNGTYRCDDNKKWVRQP